MTMEERIKNHVCCFCEGELEHTEGQKPETWGNDPSNACTHEKARCCNHCNESIVIPVRVITAQIIDSAFSDEEVNQTATALEKLGDAAEDLASIFHPDDPVFDEDVKFIKRSVLDALISAIAGKVSADTGMTVEDAKESVLKRITYDLTGSL